MQKGVGGWETNYYFQLDLNEASLIMMPRTTYFQKLTNCVSKQPVTMDC